MQQYQRNMQTRHLLVGVNQDQKSPSTDQTGPFQHLTHLTRNHAQSAHQLMFPKETVLLRAQFAVRQDVFIHFQLWPLLQSLLLGAWGLWPHQGHIHHCVAFLHLDTVYGMMVYMAPSHG